MKLCTGRKVVKVERIPRRGGVVVRWSQQVGSAKDLVDMEGSGDDAIIYGFGEFAADWCYVNCELIATPQGRDD